MDKKLYALKCNTNRAGNLKFTIASNDAEAEEAWDFFFGDLGVASGDIIRLEEVDGRYIQVVEKDTVSMYFVSVFSKLCTNGQEWDFGSRRTVGYFGTLDEAKMLIENNKTDLCESLYFYAIIQEIGVGLYALPKSNCLYKVQNKIERDEEKAEMKYEEIPLPDKFPEWFNFTI